jgi:hypothetical protein
MTDTVCRVAKYRQVTSKEVMVSILNPRDFGIDADLPKPSSQIAEDFRRGIDRINEWRMEKMKKR